MIDPKSLRIGNTVQVDGKIVPIHELLNDYAVVKLDLDSPILSPAYPCISYKKISGIPLSEQELIRLGFEYCDDPEFDTWANAKMYFKGPIQIGAHRIGFGYIVKHPTFLNGNPINNIKSVHDVQNLYYSLTGTELTYKVDSGLTPTEPDTKEPA